MFSFRGCMLHVFENLKLLLGKPTILGTPRNLKIVSTLEDQPPVASTRLQLRFGPCEFLGRIASMGEKKFDHLSSENNHK